jgi:multiple sugar transport system substrate-binding protein
VYSKHKATALDFVKFLTNEEQQKFFANKASLAPVLSSLYEDKELVSKLPYLTVLQESLANAVPRPVTPFYPGVTKAIQENSYAALKGEKSAEQALADMQQSIESATAGS